MTTTSTSPSPSCPERRVTSATLEEWLTLSHAVNAYGFVLFHRDGTLPTTCEHLAEAVAQTYDLDHPTNKCIFLTLMKFRHLPMERTAEGTWRMALKC